MDYTYGGAGGGQQAAQFYAYTTLKQMLGREPTDAEVAQAAPSYMGVDPNIANVAGGNAYVSQMVKGLQ